MAPINFPVSLPAAPTGGVALRLGYLQNSRRSAFLNSGNLQAHEQNAKAAETVLTPEEIAEIDEITAKP